MQVLTPCTAELPADDKEHDRCVLLAQLAPWFWLVSAMPVLR